MFSAAPIHSAVFFITHNPREIEEYYRDINERYCLTEFRSRVKKTAKESSEKAINKYLEKWGAAVLSGSSN